MTDQMIPARFWQTMEPGEFEKIGLEQDGCLNAEQCARLWRMQDRQGTPPQSLMVLIERKALEKWLAKKQRRGAK